MAAADGVPRCERCGAPLKPGVVLFGEQLPAAAMRRAAAMCEGADVLLCVGSSLEVHPVAGLPLLAHERGARVAILTRGDTPLDGIASVRLRGDVVEELRALGAALGVAAAVSPAG
jgi:NAD-dependent deacetylase